MTIEILEHKLVDRYAGLNLVFAYSEKSYFYNPNNVLSRGVYFATIKEADGQNDKASNLDREGVYRLSFGITKATFQRLFGEKPLRPAKGDIVNTGHNFTSLNILTPHPVYAWIYWVQILNPAIEQLPLIWDLLDEKYEIVKKDYLKKTIRKFNRKDIDAVMDIWTKTNITAHSFIPTSYWSNNAELVRSLILEADVYVCEIDGDVKGLVGVCDGYIAGVFVKEECQSMGIGKMLLDRLKISYKELRLSICANNVNAVLFFLREGFEAVDAGTAVAGVVGSAAITVATENGLFDNLSELEYHKK